MIIKDEVQEENPNKIIEVLVENMWLPAQVLDIRLVNRDFELKRIEAIRVRDLSKE